VPVYPNEVGLAEGGYLCETNADTNGHVALLEVNMNAEGDYYLEVNGGRLWIQGDMILSKGTESIIDPNTQRGHLGMHSGTLLVTEGDMEIARYGTGDVNMTGGLIDVENTLYVPKLSGFGHIQLDGGTILAGELSINPVRGTADIRGGKFVLEGDAMATIRTYVESGILSAYSGSGQVVYDYNETNLGKTTVRSERCAASDLNSDCAVDSLDLCIFARNWLASCGEPAECNGADIYPETGDGIVDGRDYALLAGDWEGMYIWPGPPSPPGHYAGHRLYEDGNFAIWYDNAVNKVYRDVNESPVPEYDANCVLIKAAKNEYEPFQLVITPSEAWQGVQLEFSDLAGAGTIAKENFSYYRVEYVDVNQTTQKLGIGRLGWTPDPLPPEPNSELKSTQNNPFWICLYIPEDANAGMYTGRIDIRRDGVVIEPNVAIEVEVWDFNIPSGRSLSIHGLLGDSLRLGGYVKRNVAVLENIAEHRFSSTFGPDILMTIDREANLVTIDTNTFDVMGQYCIDELGFNSIRFPCTDFLAHDGSHKWPADANWRGIPYFSDEVNNVLDPEFVDLYSQMITQVSQHLKSKGWLKYAFVKIVDELDGDDSIEKTAKVMELIKGIDPNIKTSWTGSTVPERLWDCVSYWVVHSDDYDAGVHQARQAAGDDFLIYNNAVMLIDYHYMRVRSFYWYMWSHKPRYVGNYFWGLNKWKDHNAPWEDPMQAFPKFNGEGCLLYPARDANEDPIVNSIRWELFRESLEDYEYLLILEELIEHGGEPNEIAQGEAALARVTDVVWDKPRVNPAINEPYTKDELLLYDVRKELAEAIVKLKN
jgi:hypothetical protein